jgi:negative regulator of replication initiation
MNMPTIRIDQDVWVFLQSKAKPFEDSPNDVLRRELGLNRPIAPERTPPDIRTSSRPHEGSLIPVDRDYTHHRVKGYKLDGKPYPANSFKDVLLGVSNRLRRQHLERFDKVAKGLFGKKRVYFSPNANDLRHPHRLSDSNLFVETNLNANLIAGICLSLLEALDHDIADFKIE